MRPRRTTSGLLAALVFAVATNAGVTGSAFQVSARQTESILDIDGLLHDPFRPAGAANVIVFVATDCPISNSYAPEIQRICRDYRSRGVACFLMYEDVDVTSSPTPLNEAVKEHVREFRYVDVPAVVDRSRRIARRAKASITPQAVVIGREGEIRYRGRIDNLYVAFGKRRPRATEHDLRDALDAVLERRPVRKVETEALGCFIVNPAAIRK